MQAHKWAGRRVAELRRLADDMTLDEFGKAMGDLGYPMSRQTVWKVERGDRPLTLDELFAAAHVLRVSPLSLLVPSDGEEFDVTDPDPKKVPAKRRVRLDGESFGNWWLAVRHPRDDVSDEHMDHMRPDAVAPFFEHVRLVAENNDVLTRMVKTFSDAIGGLPDDQRQRLREATREAFPTTGEDQA